MQERAREQEAERVERVESSRAVQVSRRQQLDMILGG